MKLHIPNTIASVDFDNTESNLAEDIALCTLESLEASLSLSTEIQELDRLNSISDSLSLLTTTLENHGFSDSVSALVSENFNIQDFKDHNKDAVLQDISIAMEHVGNSIMKAVKAIWTFFINLIKRFVKLFVNRDKMLNSAIQFHIKEMKKANANITYCVNNSISVPVLPPEDIFNEGKQVLTNIQNIVTSLKSKQYDYEAIKDDIKKVIAYEEANPNYVIVMAEESVVDAEGKSLIQVDTINEEILNNYKTPFALVKQLQQAVNKVRIGAITFAEEPDINLNIVLSKMSKVCSSVLMMLNAMGLKYTLMLKNATPHKPV